MFRRKRMTSFAPRPIDPRRGVLGKLSAQGVPKLTWTSATTTNLKPQSEYILKIAALEGEQARFIEGFQTLAIHPVRILNELLDDPTLTPDERWNLEQMWALLRDNLPRHLLSELKRTGGG